MTASNIIEQGREAFRTQAWSDAYSLLSTAAEETSLEPEDLELLARAAYLTGKKSEYTEIWARAFRVYRQQDNSGRAAGCAFWLGLTLLMGGSRAQGSGWIARAARVLEEEKEERMEQGLLLVPEALQCLHGGDFATALDLFGQAVEIGRRFDDANLTTIGQLGRGQAMVYQNNITEGTTLLDEAMVAVVAEETTPIVSGIVYCAVIETCREIYDFQRAKEWTAALSSWCEAQPDLKPYRGQCLVRRAEILQLQGDWPGAMEEVQQACGLLAHEPAAGEAYYLQAELYRLQGQFPEAEEAYRQASTCGKNPHPGLALLRLAQGQVDAAVKAIKREEEEKQDRISRSRMLPAFVEIMLAAGRVKLAKTAAGELSGIATDLQFPFIRAIAYYAEGSVRLAEDAPGVAIDRLQTARSILKNMDATYQNARTRELIGKAYRKLGDADTAEMEFEAAGRKFKEIGAEPDLARVQSLMSTADPAQTYGLTPREMEVLQFLATGKTNKAIASDLFISERTVDRHVSNILGKLNVSSRAAATAFAYEHDLV